MSTGMFVSVPQLYAGGEQPEAILRGCCREIEEACDATDAESKTIPVQCIPSAWRLHNDSSFSVYAILGSNSYRDRAAYSEMKYFSWRECGLSTSCCGYLTIFVPEI